MKKVLLTSAVALAAFGAVQAVSADVNGGANLPRTEDTRDQYEKQTEFVTADRVNEYIASHAEDVAVKTLKNAEKSFVDAQAAFDGAKAAFEKSLGEYGTAANAPENFAHDRALRLESYETALKKAKAAYEEAYATVRNEAIKHFQTVWNTAAKKEGRYYILNETPEQKNARYNKEHGVVTLGWMKNTKGQWTFVKENEQKQKVNATGWLKDNDTWYYLDKDGIMQTGWVKDNGTWYYLDGSGAMQKGWKYVGGHWYYLDGSGAMQTGWKYVSGHWYYLNASGALLVNTTTPDGYTVNGNGELV
ncbi:cell wall-binding protein [Streptococcus sp.]